MGSVSVAELQELVSQLPQEKSPHAYRLLRDLAGQQRYSFQVEFMRLPLSERRRLLNEQAAEMVGYYQQTVAERQEWQTGDLQDEY